MLLTYAKLSVLHVISLTLFWPTQVELMALRRVQLTAPRRHNESDSTQSGMSVLQMSQSRMSGRRNVNMVDGQAETTTIEWKMRSRAE